LRTPFLVKPPNERTSTIIQNPISRSKFVDDFNGIFYRKISVKNYFLRFN